MANVPNVTSKASGDQRFGFAGAERTEHLLDLSTIVKTRAIESRAASGQVIEAQIVGDDGAKKTPDTRVRGGNLISGGGVAFGAALNAELVRSEYIFGARQGHGIAAERANHLHDVFRFRTPRLVGGNNALNGPDRIVNGKWIQTKYCETAAKTVRAAFGEDGGYRYYHDGSPMRLEVPKDQYNEVLNRVQKEIDEGKIKGVSDAKEIVVEGDVTYKQACNIANAGNIDSLMFDAKNGMVIGLKAGGISAGIAFAVSVWSGKNLEKALDAAAATGLKVGLVTFASSTLAAQLGRTGLRNLWSSSVISGVATFVVLSARDVVDIFSGRISTKQLFKDLLNTGAGVAGGLGGAALGANTAKALGGGKLAQGAGALIFGAIGSALATETSVKIGHMVFGEDDAVQMQKILEDEFKNIAFDYMLNAEEGKKAADYLKQELDSEKLKDMFASSNRRRFAGELIIPNVERVVRKRKRITVPDLDQLSERMEDLLREAGGFEGVEEEGEYRCLLGVSAPPALA